MLNDPRPGDLPDESDEQRYAAVPAEGAPARPAGGGPPRSRVSPALVAGVVLALVAVAALSVWRLGDPRRPASSPVAGAPTSALAPTSSASPSTAGPSSSGVPSATPGPRPTDFPANLAAFYTQQVAWSACSGNKAHECAQVEVPVDYAKPTGDRFELALRKVPATAPSKRVGSMLINPGGPGGSGVEYAQYAQFVFSPELREVYDIVGFDPRGIGASDAVTCLTDADMDLLFAGDPTPDSSAERAKLLADADAVTKRCATRGGDRATHMSTTEVARDMDVMRVLLGDEKLNYFGVSYGTLLGSLYADLFPQKVGRFVLDSAISPNQTDLQEMTYDIQGFESSIDAFIDWCVARSDCALGTDKAAARGKIAALLDAVERSGLSTSKPGLPRIGEGWVGFAIFMCLYSEDTWPLLNRGLAQALSGKGDILLARATAVVGRDTSGNYDASSYLHALMPVRCADWPRSPDTAAVRAERAKARAAHPLWARMTGELYDNCRTWPAPGRAPRNATLAAGAAPILVIGNLRDPATPIGGTKQLAADLASGVLVTSDHDGHGTYYAGNSCVDSAVDGYLISGKVPKDGLTC